MSGRKIVFAIIFLIIYIQNLNKIYSLALMNVDFGNVDQYIKIIYQD